MEEILEGFLRILGGIIRWFVWDLVIQFVLYNIGRLCLFLLTFGRYPKGQSLNDDIEKISLFGLFVVFLALGTIALFNNFA